MRAKSKILATDNIEIEISVTATVREWRALSQQLGEAHPSWVLSSEIQAAVFKVEREQIGPFVEVPDGRS